MGGTNNNEDYNSIKDLDALEELRLDLEQMAAAEVIIPEEAIQKTAEENISSGIRENGSYVRITDDNMSAWLYLYPPHSGMYSKDEVVAFLAEAGVQKGYHNSNLTAMVKKKVYNREIQVAQGVPVKEGRDGYYEYMFPVEEKVSPRISEDGKVDYTSVNAIHNVREGAEIAIYHRAVAGEDGYDIRGNEQKAKLVKELPELRGKGIRQVEDSDVYVALYDGKIEYQDGKIEIKKCYEVNGDVNMVTGKIEFLGDITVNGNVESGVLIRASGNVEIRGSVEAATIVAGGDIVLNRGIQGGQKAKLAARGNVVATFIEYTIVNAGGDVTAGSIINSRVLAEGRVIVAGKRGNLIGGYTHGLQGVEATNIGNEVEVRTVVHAGCESEVYYKNLDTIKKEKELKKQLSEISEQLTELIIEVKQKGNTLTPALEEKLNEIKAWKEEVGDELKDIEEALAGFNAMMLIGKDAKIRALTNIYRGTVISLVQLQMPVEHNTCFMSYYIEGGMIESEVIPEY